jgi:hypothetical protein
MLNFIDFDVYICTINFVMKHKTNYISTLLRALLLFLFLGYYSSITLFYHAHLINGEVLVHSHPFKSDPNNNTPFQSHSHSSAAYNLINQLNEINWDSPLEMPNIPEPTPFYSEIEYNYTSDFSYFIYFSSTQLRAPPVC